MIELFFFLIMFKKARTLSGGGKKNDVAKKFTSFYFSLFFTPLKKFFSFLLILCLFPPRRFLGVALPPSLPSPPSLPPALVKGSISKRKKIYVKEKNFPFFLSFFLYLKILLHHIIVIIAVTFI